MTTPCPHCNHTPCQKRGKTTAGHQRYQCPGCGKWHSSSGLRGRPAIGSKAMTSTERSRRRQARLREQKNTKES